MRTLLLSVDSNEETCGDCPFCHGGDYCIAFGDDRDGEYWVYRQTPLNEGRRLVECIRAEALAKGLLSRISAPPMYWQ